MATGERQFPRRTDADFESTHLMTDDNRLNQFQANSFTSITLPNTPVININTESTISVEFRNMPDRKNGYFHR